MRKIRNKKGVKELASLGKNETPINQKYFYNVCDKFLTWLKDLYWEYLQTCMYNLIREYVTFWIESAIMQKEMAIRYEETSFGSSP
jgi:hypothetical protein